MSSINLTKKIAMELVKQARLLIEEGTGNRFDPDSWNDPDTPGLIDEINPEQSELLYWANQLIFFARTVHGILMNTLQEDAENTQDMDNTDL